MSFYQKQQCQSNTNYITSRLPALEPNNSKFTKSKDIQNHQNINLDRVWRQVDNKKESIHLSRPRNIHIKYFHNFRFQGHDARKRQLSSLSIEYIRMTCLCQKKKKSCKQWKSISTSAKRVPSIPPQVTDLVKGTWCCHEQTDERVIRFIVPLNFTLQPF